MKQAELAHYRDMLRAQAVEPSRRGIFAPREKMAVAVAPPRRAEALSSTAGPPPRKIGSLFGRRPIEAEPGAPDSLVEPLILATPADETPSRLHLHAPASRHLSATPFHAEDLADPPSPTGPTPGAIAGWSKARPPSAQTRLLRRLGAVIEAERQGLGARPAAAGLEAA